MIYYGNRAGADWSIFDCSQPEILGVLGIWPKVEECPYPALVTQPPLPRCDCETGLNAMAVPGCLCLECLWLVNLPQQLGLLSFLS